MATAIARMVLAMDLRGLAVDVLPSIAMAVVALVSAAVAAVLLRRLRD